MTVPAPPVQRVAAIINPATRGSVRALERLLRGATPPHVHLEIMTTPAPGSATALARDAAAWADRLIAVGGDGTVAAVASGILGSDRSLAIVPSGSTNVIAKELGLPNSARAAAELAFRSNKRVQRDVGVVGDRCFLHMAGAGFDSSLFENTDRALKKRIGWVAYLPAALAALQIPPVAFSIVADDERMDVESSLVLVANGSAIVTPAFRIHPDIVSDDGWLDLLVFTATDPAAVARTLGLLATARLAESPYLITRKARRIELAAEPPLPVQLDGDVVGVTPARFEIAPGAVGIVVPDPDLERPWPPLLAQGRAIVSALGVEISPPGA
ncbi:MAG TPA: YegS/Rv2252/BmrU family lipid kinase [Thermomicrobiales bacterium]|nr:YegS/Rv2252/BmrU family lipid kinase [Thermomicrobiales bacterium]